MLRKPLLAAGAALVLGVFLTSQVFAHSRPVRFDPPPGAVLTVAPAQVTGWFTADIRRDTNWSFIQVKDAQGNRVDSGDATFSTDRRQMSVNLRPGLAQGRYLVTWRTWDDGDGAIFGDCFTFFVGQAGADEAVRTNARLDGGRDCQRIDVSARDGTPVPGQTPTAATTNIDADDDQATSDSSDSSGVPVWALVLGVGVGLVVGGIGGRVLGSRS